MDSAFTIQVFTNATLNITLSTFSLWDALNPVNYRYSDLSPYSSYDTGYVFETACGADPNNQNCTASCLKPETVFGSLDTLRNCMAYPNIANEFANNRLSPDDQTTAKKLGIERTSINDTLSIDVIHTVLTCLHDYCDSLPGCMDAMKRELVDYSEGAMLNQTSTFYFGGNGSPDSDFNPCSFLPQSFLNVNQDIGGIGIYVSYWIQIGLALLGFLGIFLCGPGTYYVSLVALTPRHGHREAERRARRIRSKLRKLHLPSLATALTDFQKAQCFFMLAINIAALVDRVHGGLQPQSLQQLYNTYILIKSVSTSGYLPITFNLFTLHMVDMVSWYLLVLSAITIAISTTTFFAVGNFNPSQGDLDYLSRQAAVGGLPNCGGNVPGAWCYTPLGGNAYNYNSDAGAADPSNGAHSMLAFCLVVFVLLLAHHLWFHRHLSSLDHRWPSPKLTSTRLLLTRWSLNLGEVLMKPWEMYLAIQDKFLKHRYSQRFGRWMSNKLSCLKPTRWQQTRILSWTQSEKSIRTKRRRTRTLRTPWILTKEARTRCSRHWEALVSDIGYSTLRKTMFFLSLYVVFFSLYVNFFVIFCTDLAWFASNGVDKSNWSFGQIVAITVWAAPFCEWVYLEMRGMGRGFEHRLLPPYRVVSQPEPEDEESGVLTVSPVSPAEYAYEQEKGGCVPVAADTPTMLEEFRDGREKGDYAKVETFEEIERVRDSEEQEDITWQLPEFRRSESIRLDD